MAEQTIGQAYYELFRYFSSLNELYDRIYDAGINLRYDEATLVKQLDSIAQSNAPTSPVVIKEVKNTRV